MKTTWDDKEEKFYEREIFASIDFTETPLKNWEFYKCKFEKCIFSNCDLGNITFEDCSFDGCDFSMASVKQSSLNANSSVSISRPVVNSCSPYSSKSVT